MQMLIHGYPAHVFDGTCQNHYTIGRRCDRVFGHRGVHRAGRRVWLDGAQRRIRQRAVRLGLGAFVAALLAHHWTNWHEVLPPSLWWTLPLLMGAVSYGSSEQSVTVTGWNSLTAGSSGASASIDNSTDLYHAVSCEFILDTGGTAMSAGSHAELWLQASTDAGTTYPADGGGVYLMSFEFTTNINDPVHHSMETDLVLAVLPRNWRVEAVNRGDQTKGADDSFNFRGKKAA